MNPFRFLRNDMRLILLIAAVSMTFFTLAGCKGGSGSSGMIPGVNNSNNNSGQAATSESWQQAEIAAFSSGGMLLPNVKAAQDDSGLVHLTWFSDSITTDSEYTVNHIVWDPLIQDQVTNSSVIDIDNCRTLG
ncbi:MAG: hypothetical protein JXM72_01400, partial [Deltaproteobacteria bacterium]|nr:hypothetical protein [Deltaproteobacteria bacterium]